MENRKILELAHDKKILNRDKEAVWGWHGPAGKYRLRRRIELINKFITAGIRYKGADSIKILELGCGTGSLTGELPDSSGYKVISLDIYEGFVRKAYDRVERQGKKPIFLVGDAETLPFINESFDVILGISILHHLRLNPVLAEIRRILKPAGKFIFSEPNMLNPQIFIQKNVRLVKKFLGDSHSETAFFPNGLRDAFKEHKLNAEIFPFDFLHPGTPKPFISIVARIGLWLEGRAFLNHVAGSLLIKGEKT